MPRRSTSFQLERAIACLSRNRLSSAPQGEEEQHRQDEKDHEDDLRDRTRRARDPGEAERAGNQRDGREQRWPARAFNEPPVRASATAAPRRLSARSTCGPSRRRTARAGWHQRGRPAASAVLPFHDHRHPLGSRRERHPFRSAAGGHLMLAPADEAIAVENERKDATAPSVRPSSSWTCGRGTGSVWRRPARRRVRRHLRGDEPRELRESDGGPPVDELPAADQPA